MKSKIDYNNIILDRKSPEPLHIQLKNALLREMRTIPSNQKAILMSEREIAQLLKISRQTVHRTYQELLDQKLVHRRPDKSLVITPDSRSKITGSYRVIGILLPMDFPDYVDHNERNAIPYLKGIIGRASQLNISCMMLQVPGGNPTKEEIDDFLEEHIHRLYGLVHLGVLSTDHSKGAVLQQIMARKEIPQVCISGFCEFDHVGSAVADIEPAMTKACNIMLNSEITTMGIIRLHPTAKSPFIYFSKFRADTMKKIAESSGIKVTADICADDMAAVERLLADPNRPGVLFCHNSRIAEKVIAMARKMELDIPGDIAVFGYDFKASDANLARIDPKSEKIAAAAVDLICRHFDEGVTPENRIAKITADFINGATLIKQ